MKSALLLAVLASLTCCNFSARILAVLPFPAPSHFGFFSGVLKALTQRGHQVVEYSPFAPSKPIPNHTHFQLQNSLAETLKNFGYEEFKTFLHEGGLFGYMLRVNSELAHGVCEETFKNENIKKLMSSNETFDLVFTESTLGQESMVVFGHIFGAPTITMQTSYTWALINRDAGNALSIATIPDYNSIVASDQMSFTERIYNFLSYMFTLTSYYNYHIPSHEKLIKKYYRKDIPPLVDMISNISLYIVNGQPATDYAQPHTSNIIPVAGITISPERKPLPPTIQKLMDEAKEGVIYFSLGTVVPAHTLPKEMLQIFVNAFKKIPQKVIWRINLESIPGLPGNVMLAKWVPQVDVLTHPNCVLFITHGGLFGQQEAIYAGVPTVGIPFFAEQPFNIRFSEHRGFGVALSLKTLSEESVVSALNTVLNNPKYKENAQRMSKYFRDRPMSPADTAVYWVEYVLRHNGAHHLQPTAAKLPWY